MDSIDRRGPAHLWVVGALSLLWNAFGAYDYVMSRYRNRDYLGSMGVDADVLLAYFDAMPAWAAFGWGLGVWAALAGALLLLARSRYAVHAFAASLAGMAISFGWSFAHGTPPEMNQGAMQYMPLVILLLGLVQLWYAWTQAKRGVLR